MRSLLSVLLVLCLSNPSMATERVAAEIGDLSNQMASLKEQVSLLSNAINIYGEKIDGQWRTTNEQITLAVKIVDERFTVATLIGLGIAIGIVPAVVFLIYLPIISCVTQRTVRSVMAAQAAPPGQ